MPTEAPLGAGLHLLAWATVARGKKRPACPTLARARGLPRGLVSTEKSNPPPQLRSGSDGGLGSKQWLDGY